MKYIRTKDGIYSIDQPIQPERELQIKWIDDHCFETSWKTKPCKWKQADTIDDLIRDDDILYIHDLYPDAVLVVEGNIKPFGYNDKITLKEWLKYNDSFDLYIRNDRDNYILVAKRNDKGDWTVIK